MKTYIIDISPLYCLIIDTILNLLEDNNEYDFYTIRESLTYDGHTPALILDRLMGQLVSLVLNREVGEAEQRLLLGTLFDLYTPYIKLKVPMPQVSQILFENAYLFLRDTVKNINRGFITSLDLKDKDLFIQYEDIYGYAE